MPKYPTKPRLPDERIGQPTVSRIVRVAIAVIALFIGLNVLASWYLRHYGTNLGYRMVTAKYDMLDELAGTKPADWLILGDSSGAHGIVPEVWAEEMDGGTTHNLAILANLLVVNDAWMLEEYLERVGTPKHVVLVHAHDVWHRGYNSALIGQIPRPWGFWNRRSPSISIASKYLRNVALSRFLPLYAESGTLQAHLRHLGPDRDLNFEMDDGGWIPGQPYTPARLRADTKRTIEHLEENAFKMSKHNVRALRVLGNTADREGFDIYVTHAPMLRSIARRKDFRRYTADADARITKETRENPRVYAVSDVVGFSSTSLESYADHVNPDAAPSYTRKLAQVVKRFRTQNGLDQPLQDIRTDFTPPQGVVLERPSDRNTVSLLFGGDTSFARGIDQTITRAGAGDAAVVFEQLKPLFSSVDLTFLNLECVLSDSLAQQAKKRWKIRAPTKHVRALVDAGVDLVSVSNNHTLDFGNQGFATTLDTLEQAGVPYVGVQYSDEARQEVTITRLGDQTFGFLAYTDISKWPAVASDHPQYFWPKPANYNVDAITADIERARSQVEHLVVSVHWGDEYSMLVEDDQRAAARAFIDAGAELIIGHHPHVPRLVETYKNGLIAYSLGDLLFDKRTPYKSVRNRRRFLLQVDYTDGERSDVILHPIHSLEDHIPYPKPDLDVASWMPEPNPTPWRAADHLAGATVTRTAETTITPCDEWVTKSPTARNNGYLQWLRPRWVCAHDREQPWLTVAVSGDRSDEVYKRTIWARPHPDGPLTIRFQDVPLGASMGGIAGIPDWPLTLAGDGDHPPIQMKVSLDGAWVHTTTVPYEAGWETFTVDTSDRAGTIGTVEVQLQGGAPFETGFGFDLMVNTQP